jgi:hypothetical protein
VDGYVLDIAGYSAASSWGYDELGDVLFATVVPDADPDAPPLEVVATTIDQLLDRLDLATGSRLGVARMVLALGRADVRETARVRLASRVRLFTDRALILEASRSEVPWLAAEGRSHPLFDAPLDAMPPCPLCGSVPAS